MNEVYFLRHGRTFSNLKGFISGGKDDQLSANDEKVFISIKRHLEAELLGHEYLCFSTNTVRTRQTVSGLGLEQGIVEFDDRLLEVDAGDYAFRTWDDFYFENGHVKKFELINVEFPGGETYLDLCDRCNNFFDELITREEERSLLVCHGGAIGMILHIALGIPLGHFPLFTIDNLSLTKIVKVGNRWHSVFINRI